MENIKFEIDSNMRTWAIDENGGRLASQQSVESLLLFAILEKLEDIRCGIIDVENEINR